MTIVLLIIVGSLGWFLTGFVVAVLIGRATRLRDNVTPPNPPRLRSCGRDGDDG